MSLGDLEFDDEDEILTANNDDVVLVLSTRTSALKMTAEQLQQAIEATTQNNRLELTQRARIIQIYLEFLEKADDDAHTDAFANLPHEIAGAMVSINGSSVTRIQNNLNETLQRLMDEHRNADGTEDHN